MNGKKARKLRKMVDDKLEKYPEKKKDATRYYRRAKKLVKAGILTLCAIFIVNISHADKLEIPSVNPLKIQEVLAKEGLKLDLNIADKTPDSWGVLGFDDKGMCINTYRSVDTTILSTVTDAVWASVEE